MAEQLALDFSARRPELVIGRGVLRIDAAEALCDWLHDIPIGWEHGPRYLGPFMIKRLHQGAWSVAWARAVRMLLPTSRVMQAHEVMRAVLDYACRTGAWGDVEHKPRLSHAEALRALEGKAE